METQSSPAREVFRAANQSFSNLRGWLAAEDQQHAAHADLERHVLLQTRELGRLLLQAHMDLRALREKGRAAPKAADPKARPRTLARNLDTVLGTVRVERIAWQLTACPTVIPLDPELDLPAGLYSHGVRRFVAEQAETMSFDRTGLALHAMGISVPKRQREQIVRGMAADFDAFYAARPRPENDNVGSETILVMSVDSVGVRVVRKALREDTRKAAERASLDLLDGTAVRGDPMAPRVGHTHDRRMAVVTMTWDQDPRPRTPEDILEQFKPAPERTREEIKLPKPANRRVWGTLERSQQEAIATMFAEAQRRDPQQQRRWVVLLDGSESQREQVLAEAQKRGVVVELVLDLMHVLHYLWEAGKALHGGTNVSAEGWVLGYVERLLRRPVAFVVSGLRKLASSPNTSAKARKALRACATYLSNNSLGADYAHALARGYPIATGNVEGACRHLVRDRMDITGARWSLQVAEAMLQVRALQKSGDWDEYCRFHFAKEHDRTYKTVKTAA